MPLDEEDIEHLNAYCRKCARHMIGKYLINEDLFTCPKCGTQTEIYNS